MLTKKMKWLIIVFSILSVLSAAFGGWYASFEVFDQLISTAPTENGMIYIVDQEEGKTAKFIQITEKGDIVSKIERTLETDGSYRRYGELLTDHGDIYVMEWQSDIASGLIEAETVYRCDFEEKELVKVWDLPVLSSEGYNNNYPQVHDGVLSYLRTDYSGEEAEVQVFTMGTDGIEKPFYSFSYDPEIGFVDFYIGSCGNTAFSTPEGKVFMVEKGEDPEQVFPKDDSTQILSLDNDGEDGLYIGATDGHMYKLDMHHTGPAVQSYEWDNSVMYPFEVDSMAFSPSGRYTAATEDGTALAIYDTPEKLQELDHGYVPDDILCLVYYGIDTPVGTIILGAVIGFFVTWALGGIGFGLVRLFLFITRGKVPVVTKLLSAFLPILVVSLLHMNYMATGIMEIEMVDNQYERLYLLTSQQVSALNPTYLEEIIPAKAYDYPDYTEIYRSWNMLPTVAGIYDPEYEDYQEIYNSSYFIVYKMEGDTLLSVVNPSNYVGIPVDYQHTQLVVEQFYDAAARCEPIRTEFIDRHGHWVVLVTPIVNENNEVIAVVETGESCIAQDYAIKQGVREITVQNCIDMVFLVLILTIVIVITMHPLGILKKRVDDISEGRLGVQTKVKGHDEVAEIIRAFNSMSKSVETRDREIRQTSEGYSRFVPSKVFDLLDKSSVVDVKLADQTSVEATILSCAVESFDEISRSLRSREMFQMINRVLANLVPVINETGGMVDRFNKAGLLAIYTENPKQALDAAIVLCHTIRKEAAEETGEKDLDFHVTLSTGSAMIGIVGAEERLQAMTISEHTSFAGFLRPLAAECGVSVLITGSAAGGIPDFNTEYHVRTLGFVYKKSLNKLERLYDVYDGDDDVTKQLKKETSEQFEKGVALFCSHQYYEARINFIEVLKKNRQDLAAKHYLYLCDTYYHENAGEETDVYLETF